MNTKIKNLILIVLLLLNVAFIGGWWMVHWHNHHNMKHQGFDHFSSGEDKGMEFLSNQLNFNEDQKVHVKALWQEHTMKMTAYQNRIMAYEKQSLSYLTQDTPDSVHAFMNVDSAGIIRNEIHKELFRHFSKVRQLCNADQKKKFDEIVRNMLTKFQHHFGEHGDAMKQDSM